MSPASGNPLHQTGPDMSAEAGPSRLRALMPLHFRLVPKDIWVRIHVDTNSTIGAVKDAVLDRLAMPPTDPSLQPGFYEDACLASRGSILPTTASRVFPKSFLAREPKRTVEEVLLADELRLSERPASATSTTSELKRNRKQREKAAAVRQAATSVLRGDPGEGGLGRMGGTDMPSFKLIRIQSAGSQSSTKASLQDKLGIPKQKDHSPRKPPADTAKREHSTRPTEGQSTQHSQSAQKQAHTLELEDHTLAFGLDAYNDFGFGTLPGNEEAKKSEAAAIASLQAFPVDNAVQRIRGESQPGSRKHSSGENSPASPASAPKTDDEEDESDGANSVVDVTADEDISNEARPPSSRSSSSDSVMSITEDVEQLRCGDGESSDEDKDGPDVENGDGQNSAPRERTRSNTIRPSPDSDPRAQIDAFRLLMENETKASEEAQSVSAPFESSSSAAIDIPVRLGSTRVSRSGTLTQEDQPALSLQLSNETNKRKSDETTIISPAERQEHSAQSQRLAGIFANEISTWQGARHRLAHCYTMHSYSNGQVLEDWRTVAAFHLRPYELLELQFASPHYKMHLPRPGEATDVRGKAAQRERERGLEANPCLHAGYLEPSVEGWCYIYKRGSGPAKAQRASVGIWKLRWLTIRASKFVVFRKRPQHANESEVIGDIWNLESVDSVFTERADGATRPPLPEIAGLSREVITLSFRGVYIPPHSIHDEGDQYQKPSISMRFITALDHHAFFSTFVRARHRYMTRFSEPELSLAALEWRRRALARATIAGLGGTVMPGRAARRAGRNALARKRLRPPGIGREFDDADRWSSESESEDVGPRGRSSDFNYGGAVKRPDVSNVSSMPSLFELNTGKTTRNEGQPGSNFDTPQQKKKALMPDTTPARDSRGDLATSIPRNFHSLLDASQSASSSALHRTESTPHASMPFSMQPLKAGGIVTPERRDSLSPGAYFGSNLTPTVSQSTLYSRGSPSLIHMTAHDSRRQQRFAAATAGGDASPGEEQPLRRGVEAGSPFLP